MTDLFLERNFDPPINTASVTSMALDAMGCFNIHSVNWQHSFLASNGTKMLCWFRAPDMESGRIAMRQSHIDTRVLWRGSVHIKPGLTEEMADTANVLVERNFEEAVTLQEIQAIEDAGTWCLESRDVHFVQTFFSADHKRMICLYRAPDAESVRIAQRQAGVPFTEAWSFKIVGPEDML